MHNLKRIVAAFWILLAAAGHAAAATDGEKLDALFDALKSAEPADADRIAVEIQTEWSKSGSPAIDLLLRRGREAMEAEDHVKAVEHFSALIDHAPDFAEGYNARATAYFQMRRFGLSLSDIRVALALNPRHFEAMSGLGLILDELGYAPEALEAFRAVVELHPNRQDVREAIERLSRQVDGEEL